MYRWPEAITLLHYMPTLQGNKKGSKTQIQLVKKKDFCLISYFCLACAHICIFWCHFPLGDQRDANKVKSELAESVCVCLSAFEMFLDVFLGHLQHPKRFPKEKALAHCNHEKHVQKADGFDRLQCLQSWHLPKYNVTQRHWWEINPLACANMSHFPFYHFPPHHWDQSLLKAQCLPILL